MRLPEQYNNGRKKCDVAEKLKKIIFLNAFLDLGHFSIISSLVATKKAYVYFVWYNLVVYG